MCIGRQRLYGTMNMLKQRSTKGKLKLELELPKLVF